MQYEETSLWKATLGSPLDDTNADARERLRNAYHRFRSNVERIAGEIAKDLPDLTVHDITHIDALWGTASVLVGDNSDQPLTCPLNPAEAFLLGGAFLLHDLGNGLAAYTDGGRGVTSGKEWEDIVHLCFRRAYDRSPSAAELTRLDERVRKAALMERLRLLHAQQAERLANVLIGRRQPVYLLEDTELRSAYGMFIGRVAASHWWYLREVSESFANPVPPITGLPWRVDLLKVAVLLRLADAAQIDFTRAPSLLMEVRDLSPDSLPHWEFQERILGPDVHGERLFYRSREPFPYTMRDAWWLCFDTLQMIDRELRDVDALLASRRSDWRFTARGVAYVEDARQLAKMSIEVSGWEPVDARIRFASAANIVHTLGGQQLYGDEKLVGIRELLSNAADAVRARRLLDGEAAVAGKIILKLWEDANGAWLEIEDNGIGMKPHVVTGPLLEFGTTYWRSMQAIRDLPGLASSGFEPAGRFGIGFFSVFMLGEHVEVVSRFYRAAVEDTHVLEIKGMYSRPLLRKADERNPLEQLQSGGTRVRVRLRQTTSSLCDDMLRVLTPAEYFTKTPVPYGETPETYARRAGIYRAAALSHREQDLRSARGASFDGNPELVRMVVEAYLKYVALAVDTPILAAIGSPNAPASIVVKEDDWKNIDDDEFVIRLSGGDLDGTLDLSRSSGDHPKSSLMVSKEQSIGRIFIPLRAYRRFTGVVTAGGFRTLDTGRFAGLLLGRPTTAARNRAVPELTPEQLGEWLERHEKALCDPISWEPDVRLSTLMLRLGRRPRHLDIVGPGYNEDRFLALRFSGEVVIALCVPPTRFRTYGNVVFAPYGIHTFLELERGRDWLGTILPPVDLTFGGPLAEHLLSLLSRYWEAPLDAVKASVEMPRDWMEVGDSMREYDVTEPEPIYSKVIISRKPGVGRAPGKPSRWMRAPKSPRIADDWYAPYCIFGEPAKPTKKAKRTHE